MDASVSSSAKQANDNPHGTRRNTRSSSNQDKEKENSENSKSANGAGKEHESGSGEPAKKSPKERVIRASNGEVLEYTTDDDVTYRPLDSVYLTSERPDNPYFICTIQEIKVSKRDNAVVAVKWYYRPTEVPDLVYQMLGKERLSHVVDPEVRDLISRPDVINRELFVADQEATDTYPISCLRGKCELSHYANISEIKDFELKPDHFFYIFSYSPETRRLAGSKGETRVGPSHQWTAVARGMFQKAQLPEVRTRDRQPYEGENRVYEEMTWEPKVNSCDTIMYLRAARSLAAFAVGVCDGVSPDESIVAWRDDTTINALRVLYENNGNPRKAIDALVKNPVPVTIESKWTEEQVKRFQRGLRLHGKDFFKIRKDQLPMKETGEIVEFYYLWKKTQDGLMIRPHHRKHRRQAAMKKSGKYKNGTNTCSGDQTSTEEEAEESEESEKEVNGFKCKHCLTSTSKDWLVGGKEGVMLCTDCRIFYKKYGENRPVVKVEDIDSANEADIDTPPATANQMPPFLFKPIKEEKMTNLIPRKPAKTMPKVAPPAEVKKPNKRQWSEPEEAQVKHNVMQVKLKRPKTEPEEVHSRLQTNQDEGTKTSKANESSIRSTEKAAPPVPESKPFVSGSGTVATTAAPAKPVHAHPYQHSFTKDQLVVPPTTTTHIDPLKSISSLCSATIAPFVSAGHGGFLDKGVKLDTKTQLGLNTASGIVPRNGVYPTVAYFGSSTAPTSNPTPTTTGGHHTTHSMTGTTTVSTAHSVRLSPTVEHGANTSRPPKPEGSHPRPESPRHGPEHIPNPHTGTSTSRQPTEPGRQGRGPSPVVKTEQYYRPPKVKEELNAYRQPSHQPHETPYRCNPRFPFDPFVTDQIISNANTIRTTCKEEVRRGSPHSRPPYPHPVPSRASPGPPKAGAPHPRSYRPAENPAGHRDHSHQRHSPGSRPHLPHAGAPHPPQHQPTRTPEKSSPRRQNSRTSVDRDGDSDVEVISATRAETPPPTRVEVLTYHGKTARFLRVWNRGMNSCFRTDYVYKADEASAAKRKSLRQETVRKEQQQQQQPQPVPTQPHQERPGQTPHSHQRTPSHSRLHSDQEKKREEKPESSDRARREGPGPLSTPSLPPPARTTPSHAVPRSTPTRTPTTVYEQHHRPGTVALMSPYSLGSDTPALRQLQQYASYDMQRNAEAMGVNPLLYPYYLAAGERELRERELRERESRERMAKMGVDVKPGDLLDPHHSAMQQLPPGVVHGIPQGIHMPGVPVSMAGPHLPLEQQLQLRQHYQAQLLSSLPPGAQHAALAAAAGLPHGIPFASPEAYAERLSAERLQAERLAAEQQYQLELLHHHQHSHVHSHLHLHQPGQPGAPPPPGGAVPLPALPPPPSGLAVVPELLGSPYMQAAMSPFAAPGGNPLLLNPAIRSQQAALMHPLHAAAVANREQAGQPHPLSATQHLQAVHEQHLIESTQRARAFAALEQQQYMARLAGHKP